jgi:SAM-dependent methyltransferase
VSRRVSVISTSVARRDPPRLRWRKRGRWASPSLAGFLTCVRDDRIDRRLTNISISALAAEAARGKMRRAGCGCSPAGILSASSHFAGLSMLRRLLLLLSALLGLKLLNVLSYSALKARIVRRQRWDLNICCGKTDGGGVNADIVQHGEVPNFVLLDSVYDLPFEDDQFDTVLCSHTMEHVEDPERFFDELQRVGREVTLVLPPLWDVSAVLNVLEHRWIFLTFAKEHTALPPHVRLPFAARLQRCIGQRIHA